MNALSTLGLLMAVRCVWAQPPPRPVIVPVPGNYVLDGRIGEWEGVNPTVAQPADTGRPPDMHRLWAGTSADGLVVAGDIRVAPWEFTLHPKMQGATVDIGLSVAEPFDLPKIQFDDKWCNEMGDYLKKDRSPCLQWVKDQGVYRDLLQKQFSRSWRIAPDGAEEISALPAYDQLTAEQRQRTGLPRPAGLPHGFFRPVPETTTTFELLIPWEIFPPANRLNLERIQLKLNVEGGYGVPQSLWLAVIPPITARVTTCGQPLPVEGQPLFYFLNQPRQADTAFTFEDHQYGWLPYPPPSADLSPEVRPHKYFTQALSPGEYLCGPYMSYRRGTVTKNYPLRIDAPPDQEPYHFPVKVLADGTRLIRSGPGHWPLPEGWRHSYDIMKMSIYALTPSLQAYEALHLIWMIDSPSGYEIEISGDWRTVTEFTQGRDDKWSSETFCLTGHVYKSCRSNPDSPPPKKRVLTRGN